MCLESDDPQLETNAGPVALQDVGERSNWMAANAKQGSYVVTTLVGFTAFPAGLAGGGGLGIVIAIVGIGLLVFSAVGFYRIKNLPSTN